MTDESFGVVPVVKKKDVWHFLLVNQIPHRGGQRYWTFPKGHPEGSETPIQTARRELKEETGVTDVEIIEKAQFVISYSFTHQGTKIDKTVTYFLGLCHSDDKTITNLDEIADCNWYPAEAAMAKMTHENTKHVLTEAVAYLNQHEDLS